MFTTTILVRFADLDAAGIAYYPRLVAGIRSTAIAWTTASSVVSVIEMVRAGSLPQRGFLKQEDIPLDAFLATSTGRSFTTHGKNA